jgi:hypothetical protein
MIANPGASSETYNPRGHVLLDGLGEGSGVVAGVEGLGSALDDDGVDDSADKDAVDDSAGEDAVDSPAMDVSICRRGR